MVLARASRGRIRRGIGARARSGRASETPPAESRSFAREQPNDSVEIPRPLVRVPAAHEAHQGEGGPAHERRWK